MLSTSQYKAYQDFLTLLIDFNYLLRKSADGINKDQIELGFERLRCCYEKQIMNFSEKDIEQNSQNRWQSIQREIQREFKLLSTGILFLKSARKETTKQEKLNNIQQNTTKLIDYCELMTLKYKE